MEATSSVGSISQGDSMKQLHKDGNDERCSDWSGYAELHMAASFRFESASHSRTLQKARPASIPPSFSSDITSSTATMTTTALPASTTTFWSSFDRLAKIDRRYKTVVAKDPNKQPDGDCSVGMDLLHINSVATELEQTYLRYLEI